MKINLTLIDCSASLKNRLDSLKQDLDSLKQDLDIDTALTVLEINTGMSDNLLDIPVINWDVLSDKKRNIENYFSDNDIEYAEELYAILKEVYNCKLQITIATVHKNSGFELNGHKESIIPTKIDFSKINIKNIGLEKVLTLYNSNGYQALNSGAIVSDILSFELLAACKSHLLERIGYEFYRNHQKVSDGCLNVTSLIERRLQPYLIR